MVQQGDFKLELVYADTRKLPFQEHAKDENIYAEVEPDVDYFISIQRNGISQPGCVLAMFIVDEQDLGYHDVFASRSASPIYRGLYSRAKAVSTMKALKFVKPSISQDGTKVSRNLLMGKIEVKLRMGTFSGYTVDRETDFNSAFATKNVDINQTGLAKKKSLRSGEGTVSESNRASTGQTASYEGGEHLDTITLNFCAALGLMEVGVLQKPDAWTYHRMKRPAGPSQGPPAVRPKKIHDPAAAEAKTVELFDLAEANSDDE